MEQSEKFNVTHSRTPVYQLLYKDYVLNLFLYVNDGDYVTVHKDNVSDALFTFCCSGYCYEGTDENKIIGKISIGQNDKLIFKGKFKDKNIFVTSDFDYLKDYDAYFKMEAKIATVCIDIMNYGDSETNTELKEE